MGRVNQRLNSIAKIRSSTSSTSASGARMERMTSAAVEICARLVDTMTPYRPSAESRPTSICWLDPARTTWYSAPFLKQFLPASG